MEKSSTCKDIQTSRQAGRYKGRQAVIQASNPDIQAGRKIDIQAVIQAGNQSYRHGVIKTGSHIDLFIVRQS